MLFLRRKKMAVFLFDRGSRNKDQQQQEEEKKKKAESRHHRHDDGLYGSVVSSSSSSSKSGNSHSKGPSSIECDSSPNVTSPSSDCSARNEADGAGGGGWYGDGFEGGGGGGAAYEAGSYQLGSYRHYGGGSGVFPSPAPRRSLSPIGSSEWALRECELHTTWLNEVRKRCGQPAITDLRTAVADGVTVVQLTKALTSHEVCPVEQDQRLTKAQAQVNLDRCLAQLAAGGVDVIGVQANDLAEGDLKASLLLLGQIRRRYDTESAVRRSPAPSRGRAADSQHAHRAPFTETVSVHPQPAPRRLSPDMPGRLDVSQSHTPHRPDVSPRTRRARTTDDDRYLPGVSAGSEDLGAMANHMRQHSADHLDRRPPAYNHHHFNANIASTHHPAHATSAKPSPAPRPHSSMGVTSAERPPSQLGVAWSADSASKTRQVSPSPPSPSYYQRQGNGSHGNVDELEEGVGKLKIGREKKRPIHYV